MALSGATTGKVGINSTKTEFYLNQRVALFKNFSANRKYVFYFLKHESNNILNKAYGCAQPNISTSQLESIIIPVPQMEVQGQIVAELDKINEIISDCKGAICNLDNLAQSLFYDCFGDPITNPKGWDVKPLSDLVEGKLEYGSGASGVPFDGKIRYIRITDIDENGNLKPQIASSPSIYESKYDLHDGDILFARSGATVGKTFLYKSRIGKAINAGYLIRATPKQDTIRSLYLYNLTKTSYYLEFIKKSIYGAAQPNVNAKAYGSLLVPLPPMELQEKFAARVEQIEEQKKGLEETIANMQTLLDSRMDYWFN